jgi:hypothetical protein
MDILLFIDHFLDHFVHRVHFFKRRIFRIVDFLINWIGGHERFSIGDILNIRIHTASPVCEALNGPVLLMDVVVR